MDIGTVLTIINMIDAALINLDTQYTEGMNDVEYHSAGSALSGLRDHLQLGIEEQINAMENQSPE
jgi:hypothetical protein